MAAKPPQPQRTITSRVKKEERLLRFSFVCSLLFTITEVTMAFVLHSYSILMDGVYDVADLVLLGPFLVLVPLLYKPVTEKHPYGYSQFESVFLIVKYGILLFAMIWMIIENIRSILNGGHTIAFGRVAVYELVIGVLCVAVYCVLRYKSRKSLTPTIAAELYLWKQDIANSIGLSAGFFAQIALSRTPLRWLVPYMDSVIAIVMAGILIREPVQSIAQGLRELVLMAPDAETMGRIREEVNGILEEYLYSCTFLDVIQTGRKIWVEVYLTPDQVTGTIDVRHWAAIRAKIRLALERMPEKPFEQIYVELIPDIPDAAENRPLDPAVAEEGDGENQYEPVSQRKGPQADRQ